MKIAVLFSLLASAGAFAPAKTASQSSALKSFEKELGAQQPLGFWDPLGWVDGQDQARFDRLRYVELKHGRIAQLAVLGHIWTTAGNRLPGNIDYAGTSFASIKVGLAGLKDIPTFGLIQIVAFIGFLELFVMKDAKGTGEFPGRLP
ncbi:fucoxanthin chlorophyll a c protein [Fragilaria crotonensis]|nr:fucoxanthin chlorophyll a c protein [Fragilaria crotonensis]